MRLSGQIYSVVTDSRNLDDSARNLLEVSAPDVELKYDFALHQHRPYSFDLSADLAEMVKRDVLSLRQRGGYGPSFRLERWGERHDQWVSPAFIEANRAKSQTVGFIARNVATQNAIQLERIATAFFLHGKEPQKSDEDIAVWITELKPHIPLAAARVALQVVERLR